MLLLNPNMSTSPNIAPSEILKRLGLPAAGVMPEGVAVGPFLWKGLFDFDAAAASVVSDLLAYDNFDWHAFIPRLNKATENKPEVILAISGIEVIFIDQGTLEHADPEDVFKAFEGIYLEATQKGRTRTWALRDGCHVAAKPAGLIDSDQATEVRAYQYPTKGLQLFPEGTLLFDMSDLNTLQVKADSSATNSLLGANGTVRIRIHGAAWDSNYSAWSKDKEQCAAPPTAAQAIVDMDERRMAQAKLIAQATLQARY